MFLFPNAIRGLSCKFTKFQMPANFPAKNLNSGTIVHCLNKRLVDLSRRESDELMSIWKRYSSVLNVEHWNQSRARQTVGMKFIQRIKRKLVEQRLKHLVNYFMICTNRHDLQFKISKMPLNIGCDESLHKHWCHHNGILWDCFWIPQRLFVKEPFELYSIRTVLSQDFWLAPPLGVVAISSGKLQQFIRSLN